MTVTNAGAAQLLAAVREQTPLVQCITNSVVTNFTANVLLASGAAPAMTDIVGEAGLFAGIASGVLINLGTPTPEQREASREAVAGAAEAGTPWVLDPVAVGALPVRTELARELVAAGPTAIRGNASEIMALAGAGAGGRGVESSDEVDAAVEAAVALAQQSGAVVAVSGPKDFITDGQNAVWVDGGSELLTKVTGGGCALGALIAAFLGARGEASALEAVAATHAFYSLVAERAAAKAHGPGTFAVALIDELSSVTPDDLAAVTSISATTTSEN
ncbi:hydroxyethylthiazole kinase [Corynebacterium aquatimens]|uniref:Hydroxyethylthiazole kinase n=1 Tax=Corynebacterium aquatimens TaxID=1190508 RepID=A0A931E587_9CORY|nr:hydroxyethylthiazole kinase [Corynebacterium aquatimens]MBG6122673.1 hydroxyethylthiazole kinase [Corynebacterium aquatimens]WJY64796.1 Hydroxyethylthiazole kinase [Corynebacterium aquatimens]